MGLLGGIGGTSKQASTMPNVVVRCCACSWARWAALWGGKFYIWEGIIYCQPIWDVFAPQRERGRAGEEMTMRFRSPSFPIRQAVPVGLVLARFCCWACWAQFFRKKKRYYISYYTFTCIPIFFVSRGLGMGG